MTTKNMFRILTVISVVGISLFSSHVLLAQSRRQGNRPQGQMRGRPQGGPPPEALEACQNKQAGDSCRFESPHGTIDGQCRTIQNQSACVPEGMGDGPPQNASRGNRQQGPMSDNTRQAPQKQRNTQSFAPYTDAIAVSSTVIDTGQNRCYDEWHEIACPSEDKAFYGQDAHYQSNATRYRDNGDGTVSDLNTGLMWQQDPGEKMTYSEAVEKAETFRLAGYSDWRLPTIKELYSLIDFSGVDVGPATSAETGVPFIDRDFFRFSYGNPKAGERLLDSQFISSTLYVSTTMRGNKTMFGVNFADGRIKGYGISGGRGGRRGQRSEKTFYMLYVRGDSEYATNNFQDQGDGAIEDTGTGLMWMQTDSAKGMEWEEALDYCETLDLAGYTDWRLPNAKELQSLVDYTRSPATTNSAAIDPIFSSSSIIDEGGNKNYPFYWTSTTHLNEMGAENAVYIAFGEALGWMSFGGGTPTLMDVHGAGAQRSDPKTGNTDDYPQGHGPQGDVVRINNYVRCVR